MVTHQSGDKARLARRWARALGDAPVRAGAQGRLIDLSCVADNRCENASNPVGSFGMVGLTVMDGTSSDRTVIASIGAGVPFRGWGGGRDLSCPEVSSWSESTVVGESG